MLLKDKTAVITGCSRGIGKAILEIFSLNGANIFACTRNINDDFNNFIDDLKKKYNNKIFPIKIDLNDQDQIKKGTSDILSSNLPIDILINNAGAITTSLFQMTSEKQIKEIFEVNYFSQLYFTQSISRVMSKNKKGNIIFISSTSGINGDYGRFAYSATKAAILNTVKTLSKELAKYNVRVNAISPGLTETDLMLSNTKEETIKSEIKKISLNRVANTKEISSVILFLASDKSSYINGQNLIVDGGYL